MRERKVRVLPRSKLSARRPGPPSLLTSFTTTALALVLVPFAAGCTSSIDGGPSAALGGAPTDVARGGSSAGIASIPGGATATSGSGGVPGGAGPGPAAGGATAGAAQGGSANLGQPEIANKAIHRLSNVEYDATLRDLTGTELHFAEGFANEEAEGFDNIATALSMSPRQVEDYFAAALKVSADVFAKPALRDRIVTCTPDAGTTCAETVIRDFGRRAFRRPLSADESADLLSKYQEALTLGVDAMAALQHVVHIVLASPQFLYRIEYDPDLSNTAPHPLDGYELASRLSYALWSTMPDEALFAEAAAGALATPEALRAQVDRMLADPHSEMLAKNFAARWFGSKRLDEHVASPTVYPAYSAALAASMKQEMELYFSEFLNKDLPYAEFLSADFNFVDGPLATLYGMAAPAQPGMVRVTDTTDKRKGLLGLAGFLTHTSRETRSSPIIRGKWILDAVWCTPLTVPAGLIIEALEEPAEGSPPTTVRLQMEAHRVSPACSGCHDLMDPIGLALENFDSVGRYRAVYENGLAIDTTGTMPGGQQVQDLESLATVLGTAPQFLSCAASKFGTYALGLVFPPVNRDQIVARWTAGTPTLRNLIKETVTHDTFRSRRAESP
jgi:hypothetical protein